jgi:HD-GYP domain-containing protein (c-di-GMP phosphodiesterase class II)
LSSLELRVPVETLDGEALLPAGTRLDDALRSDLVASGARKNFPRMALLGYGTFRRDLHACVRQGAYRVIFDDPEWFNAVLSLMENTHLPVPVLEVLRYFQRHDPYTYRHTLMVFALSCLLARDLGHERSEILLEAAAGPLHDIGKLSVPMKVLKKTTPLTRSERYVLENHTVAGHVLLCYYLGNPERFASRAARDHHERGDGSGYPRGIRLNDRLLEIVAACDVYDALISPRPYRQISYDNRTAIEEITRMAEQGKIRWEIVSALVAHNRKHRPPLLECKVSREKRGTPPEGNCYGTLLDEDPPDSSG